MQKLFSIVLMLVLLLLAFVLDRWGFMLRELGAQTFDVNPRIWGGILSDLVFMIAVLGFAWLVFQRVEGDWLVSLIHILVGAFTLFYLPLLSLYPQSWRAFFQSGALRGFTQALMQAGLRSFFSLSSAAILVTGIVGILAGGEATSSKGPSFE